MHLSKYIVTIGIVGIFLFACKKEKFTIENLNGNKIQVFGHGGMGMGNFYPMNSFEAIYKCLLLGTDGVEIDVQMTKDNVLILFHNEDLSQGTSLKGKIRTLSWNEIKKGYTTADPYKYYNLISLEELFENLDNPQKYHYTLDCKLFPALGEDSVLYETAFLNELIRIIDKFGLTENCLIELKDERQALKLKTERPNYKIFVFSTSFDKDLEMAKKLDLHGITIAPEGISKDQIKQAHQNGIKIAIYGVSSQSENIDAIRKSPDIIQTNKVENLLKLLK
jgi:glycerophosphoryl diester phosphodiesterase